MGTIINGNKWAGACVNGNIVSGLVKNGAVFYKKNADLLQINDMNIESHGYSLSVQNGIITLNGS